MKDSPKKGERAVSFDQERRFESLTQGLFRLHHSLGENRPGSCESTQNIDASSLIRPLRRNIVDLAKLRHSDFPAIDLAGAATSRPIPCKSGCERRFSPHLNIPPCLEHLVRHDSQIESTQIDTSRFCKNDYRWSRVTIVRRLDRHDARRIESGQCETEHRLHRNG